MASSSHQQGNGHLKYTSNSPCFFKIILQDSINNGKLGIPRKFVKEHGNSMSSPAMLRVPSGEVWKVELTKCDGQIWLEKGWLEFSNHYSLEFGIFLVFRYDGNSNFHVIIFDKSATEIQYPHTSNNSQPCDENPKQLINNYEDLDFINILDSKSPSRKMREKSQSPSPRPHKMMRSTHSAITTETKCNENHEFLVQQGCSARKYNNSRSYDTIRMEHEGYEALERVRNTFQSENPFFLVLIQPSYLYRLTVPTNFVREHLTKEHCSITLCNLSGKTWIVTLMQKHFSKYLLSQIQKGWGAFVQDNNIKVGDVCVFELINSIEISFRVIIYQGQHANGHQSFTSTHVFRPVERKPPSNASWRCLWPHKIMSSANSTIETDFNGKSGCPAQSVRYNEKDKALGRDGNSVNSENPSFLIGMQPSHVGQDHCKNYRLGIPCNFAQKHIMKEHSSVTLCSSGKTWSADISRTRVGNNLYSFLQAGWRIFVRDNSIQLGDVCSFELINSIELSFEVVIQKGQHEKSCHQSASTDVFRRVKGNDQSCATSSPSFPEPLTDLKRARGFQVADASESENPFFSVVLKPSSANYNRLIIPVNFARQYLKKMQKKVILLLSNGKSWPVKYYQHLIAGPKPFAIFSNGWSRFAVDNNLEVGDVCRFELTKGAETSMSVTITRKQAVEDANLGSSSDDRSREKQGEFHETASMKNKEDMFTRENNGEATGDFDDISAVKDQFSRQGLRIGKPNCQS